MSALPEITAKVVAVHGGAVDPATGDRYGPASSLTYDIVVHQPSSSRVHANVRPTGNRWPDTIDTIAAKPGTPVGIAVTGPLVQFFVPEMPVLDEVCE